MRGGCSGLAAAVAIALLATSATRVGAETLESALAQAYRNNEQLNAERAAVRAMDESVPQALSDYRPRVNATVDIGRQYIDERGGGDQRKATTTPRSLGLSANQTLFNGHQTANRVRTAESQVLAAREVLRVMEQTVLLDAVSAYMDVLRDGALAELQQRNVEALREQLEQTRTRLTAGFVTPTDVAQAQSRLAAARSQLLAAQAAHNGSRADYERVIGTEPGKLAPGRPVDRLSPAILKAAIAVGQARNPSVAAAMLGVDIAQLQTKIAEGALYPTLTLEGNLRRRYDTTPETDVKFPASGNQASIVSRLIIPLYQGGGEYARIRQSKETLGQKRLTVEAIRKLARATIIQSWSQLDASKAQVEAAESQVAAAELAFEGVRREAQAGQRTTFELLNAQQELVSARVAQVTAQRNRVVASYALLAAIGRLSPQALGLPAEIYDPSVHYHQVRDSWFGVRTPDGR